MSKLMLHAGGWDARLEDLQAVPAPEQTKTHHPIRHDEFVERVIYELPRFGLETSGAQYALSHEGKRFFGIVKCARMSDHADYSLVIGLRNSYDKSISPELCAGTQVFICDNLAFHGESRMKRKSTLNLFRDLPMMIYQLLQGLQTVITRTDDEVETWKNARLEPQTRDHVLVEVARRRGIPWSAMPKVLALHQHDARFNPETVWGYFNAFTGYAKDRSPAQQMEETRRVSDIFRTVWPPATHTGPARELGIDLSQKPEGELAPDVEDPT